MTAKNRFQIINLHPKKHIFKEKKYTFLMPMLKKYLIGSYVNKYPRHKTRPLVVEQSGQCTRVTDCGAPVALFLLLQIIESPSFGSFHFQNFQAYTIPNASFLALGV